MRIVVSKAYLKWKKANKDNRALDVVDNFLARVFKAPDITQVSPRPKSAGSNLRKSTGTVDEFTLNKQYRVYAKCAELTPGQASFCLATIGVKGNTKQNDDILTALSFFDNIGDAEWEEWRPTDEHMASSVAPDEIPVDDHIGTIIEEPKQPAAKKKGKPLDENGLTVAERKALRKQQKQEEQRKRTEEKRKAQQLAAQEAHATTDNANVAAPVDDDISDDEIRIIQPQPITGDEEFKDIVDVHYHLELIEHRMTIERLKIKMIQHEIALEELEIQKKHLLHMQQQGLEK